MNDDKVWNWSIAATTFVPTKPNIHYKLEKKTCFKLFRQKNVECAAHWYKQEIYFIFTRASVPLIYITTGCRYSFEWNRNSLLKLNFFLLFFPIQWVVTNCEFRYFGDDCRMIIESNDCFDVCIHWTHNNYYVLPPMIFNREWRGKKKIFSAIWCYWNPISE